METIITAIKWVASISGIVAALMVSLDSGRRVTGWGFVIFSGSALCWLVGAMLSRDGALGTQNVALLAIDVFGIYRYLIRKKADGSADPCLPLTSSHDSNRGDEDVAAHPADHRRPRRGAG